MKLVQFRSLILARSKSFLVQELCYVKYNSGDFIALYVNFSLLSLWLLWTLPWRSSPQGRRNGTVRFGIKNTEFWLIPSDFSRDPYISFLRDRYPLRILALHIYRPECAQKLRSSRNKILFINQACPAISLSFKIFKHMKLKTNTNKTRNVLFCLCTVEWN